MKRLMTLLITVLLSQAIATAGDKKDSLAGLKESIMSEYGQFKPDEWGEKTTGVGRYLNYLSEDKMVALTFDACGSENDGYDKELIEFLIKEQVQATLFINGRWIKKFPKQFKKLAKDHLFEIENHGTRHVPLSVSGRSVYGIEGTHDAAEVAEEIEGNARLIHKLTGRTPLYFRSGTAYYDEVAVLIAQRLGYQVAGFSVLGDAGATYSSEQVKNALLDAVPGDIIIMHMNHPEKETAEGVMDAIPLMKAKGITFVKLEDWELR